MDGWSAVRRARAAERPRAAAYLEDYFDCRVPISGERVIAFAAQTGTASTPAGFRTAARLIRLASRSALPVPTLVDTPGAANDPAAERAGVGAAIAELFAAVTESRVPITTLVRTRTSP